MDIRAVFFDLGGVILRTEYQAPREHLAERLKLSSDDLERMVFESPSARRAYLGETTADEHWQEVAKRLGQPASGVEAMREEFFAGDVLDRDLLDLVSSLRPSRRTGLISNAWSEIRPPTVRPLLEGAFDVLVISAEVGLLKPDPAIYQLALTRIGVAPAAALFIDDMPVNVEAAQALGMSTIHFQDPVQLRREMEQQLG